LAVEIAAHADPAAGTVASLKFVCEGKVNPELNGDCVVSVRLEPLPPPLPVSLPVSVEPPEFVSPTFKDIFAEHALNNIPIIIVILGILFVFNIRSSKNYGVKEAGAFCQVSTLPLLTVLNFASSLVLSCEPLTNTFGAEVV
jgi:hypothetical protein